MSNITNIVPDHGPLTGGNAVIITGTGFTGISTVDFGPYSAVFTVDSDSQITATAPDASDSEGGGVFIFLDGVIDPEFDGVYTFGGATPPVVLTDYQFAIGVTVFGAGTDIHLDALATIEGLGVPDAKTQDVTWNFRDGSYGNPDYVQVRVITIPAIIKAANETDALDALEALTLDWVPQPADSQLTFQLPGWGVFYVLGRPRGVKADVTHARRGVIRVLLRFDCLSPEVVFVP